MKSYLAAFIAALILIGFAVFGQLKTPEEDNLEFIFLIDKTDTFQTPNWTDVKEKFGLKTNKWKGVKCSFIPLTNLRLNKEYTAILEPKNKWLNNEIVRNDEISNFSKNLDSAISEIASLPVGIDKSSVYLPFARKLNSLAESEIWTLELHIVSDLMENSKEISFYDPRTLALIQTHPDVIIKQLQNLCPLKSLRYITIHIYFIPQTEKQDEQFEIVSRFYKTMLEQKGATVIIN
ncbi:MAG: hypothetical protein POELPBGB_02958 [Bacteroidia bacterium]|nr:hypothetical protein [Bacteroidia bacterium]